MAGWSSMWGRIETEDQALQVIREASKGFFVIAGLQALFGVLIYPPAVLDAVVYGVLGFWLRKTNSRIAAVLLLVVTAGALCVTVVNRLGGGFGGRNIFLAAMFCWVGIRVVQAAFKVSGGARPSAGSTPAPVPVPGGALMHSRVKVYG
jgi:hypothetical protein